MPVEIIHSLIGSAYLILWLVIAQISFRQNRVNSEGISGQEPW